MTVTGQKFRSIILEYELSEGSIDRIFEKESLDEYPELFDLLIEDPHVYDVEYDSHVNSVYVTFESISLKPNDSNLDNSFENCRKIINKYLEG